MEASEANLRRAGDKIQSVRIKMIDWQNSIKTAELEKRGQDGPGSICLSAKIPSHWDIPWESVETVACLRNALNKAISEIVPKDDANKSFVDLPFLGKGVDRFEESSSSSHKRLIKALRPQHIEIINFAQPFSDSRSACSIINRIANSNKHRSSLVEISPSFHINGMTISNGVIGGNFSLGEGVYSFKNLADGAKWELMSYDWTDGCQHPDVEIHRLHFTVRFGEKFRFADESVYDTLVNLHANTQEIINRLKNA